MTYIPFKGGWPIFREEIENKEQKYLSVHNNKRKEKRKQKKVKTVKNICRQTVNKPLKKIPLI